MKKFNIAWTLPCFLLAGNASANIIISEVVEGSSYNKAIEIANVGYQTITLNGYKLQKETNFGGVWSSDYELDGITLAPMTTYVIGHNHANVDPDLQARVDDFNGNITNFNGDDPLRLLLNGEVIDMFGPNSDVTTVTTSIKISLLYVALTKQRQHGMNHNGSPYQKTTGAI